MGSRFLTMVAVGCALAASAVAASQPPAEDERRAAITVMRAINTAEHAVKQRAGRFVHLAQLVEHPAMGRVRGDIAVTGSSATYQGSTIRLTLSADGSQYHVAVIPAQTCGWAAFSDERGLIYTGKVLDC